MGSGILHLLPLPLSGAQPGQLSSESVEIARRIKHYIAEKAKTARQFLKSIRHPLKIADIEIAEMAKHRAADTWPILLGWLQNGHEVGLISEAGMPCIADPGHELVLNAHQHHFRCIPHPGPNSILMALMASGLQAQHFCFHGYLPAKKHGARAALNTLVHRARAKPGSHIFMETPYRNNQILELTLALLPDTFLLCVASGIGTPLESIQTMLVSQWKKRKMPNLDGIPCLYIFSAG